MRPMDSGISNPIQLRPSQSTNSTIIIIPRSHPKAPPSFFPAILTAPPGTPSTFLGASVAFITFPALRQPIFADVNPAPPLNVLFGLCTSTKGHIRVTAFSNSVVSEGSCGSDGLYIQLFDRERVWLGVISCFCQDIVYQERRRREKGEYGEIKM
jgi:hypothetical protein